MPPEAQYEQRLKEGHFKSQCSEVQTIWSVRSCLFMSVHLSAAVWLLESLEQKQEMLSRTVPVLTACCQFNDLDLKFGISKD